MPQLLNYLKLDHSDANVLDWGTLLIFTCSKSCSLGGKPTKEALWRQMFTQDGITEDKIRKIKEP
jgi:pre-rRNA-processing protein TSR4